MQAALQQVLVAWAWPQVATAATQQQVSAPEMPVWDAPVAHAALGPVSVSHAALHPVSDCHGAQGPVIQHHQHLTPSAPSTTSEALDGARYLAVGQAQQLDIALQRSLMTTCH